ncbi:hypothetical protein Ae201684P_010897 [Aphanomyces euteiches]|nr:hypothetical protein Ae201684P_010897 [Aphanomyces euteiches]
MNTLFSKIAACRDTLDGYSGAYTMTSALKKLRSSLKRAKMESKDVVVEHMLPLAREIQVAVELGRDGGASNVWCGRFVCASVGCSVCNRLRTCCLCRSWTLLVCVASRPTMTQRSAWPARIASKALAATTLLSVETLYAYFKTARATRNHRTEGGWKRHLVVKLLGITVETCTKEELEPQYSLLKEFVREALHDNFLLVRVEARQVFSSLYDTWPERVNEFVYLPAPRIRAVLMADGYATTGIGLALQRKFQSKTPAAVKRDPPKVVGPRPAVNPPNVVDFHMLLVVQLLAVLFTATVAVWQRLPSFGRRMSKVEQPTRDPPVSKGSSSRLGIDQASNDASALEGATAARTHGRRASGESSS